MNQAYVSSKTPIKLNKSRLRMWPSSFHQQKTAIHKIKSSPSSTYPTSHPSTRSQSKQQTSCLKENREINVLTCTLPNHTQDYTSSLRTHKKQYLKLFTTSNIRKEKQPPIQERDDGIYRSSMPFTHQYPQLQQRGDRFMPDNEIPKRKLFDDLVIEKEAKIIVDPNENKIYPNICRAQDNQKKLNTFYQKSQDCYLWRKQLIDQQVCRGCLAILPPMIFKIHQQYCPSLQSLKDMSPAEQKAANKQRGKELITCIERDGDWSGLGRSWSNFLKECELVWSTGKPSSIYCFKLKELQAKGRRLAKCLQDMHRLNFLLLSLTTQ